MFARHKTVPVKVGDVVVGGDAPVVVQSMTNTPTEDVIATVEQIKELVRAGSELVRITVNHEAAAHAVPIIRDKLDQAGLSVPLVGDFHFNGHRLLTEFPACARALAKYRINPGNMGSDQTREAHFATMIDIALEHDKPVRIGVNWGSLDKGLVSRMMDDNARSPEPKDADEMMRRILVVSALESARHAERLGLPRDHIIISCKVSGVRDLIGVYRELAVQSDYALHLGLTEAGMGSKGIVSSTAALAVLLEDGIGDTIRISLTPEPGQPRTAEVEVAQQILQSMDLRSFMPQVIACPGCGRTTSTFFQELAQEIQGYLRDKMPEWRCTYPGVESMNVAVMGCIVNGPGESKHADIGISLPGSGEQPAAPVFVDGKKWKTLKGDTIAEDFKQILDEYVTTRYGKSDSKEHLI